MQAEVLGSATSERPSLLYAAPGPYLTTTGGSAVCVLSSARELARYADVTVAFRGLVEAPPDASYRAIALQDGGLASDANFGDRGSTGPGWGDIPYLHRLSQFAADNAGRYDVVLEHGWGVCGHLLAAFQRHGVPGAAVMGTVRTAYSPIHGVRDLSRLVTVRLRHALSWRRLRAVPCIIAETEQMKSALVRHLEIPAERVRVVGLGLDHSVFRPLCQASARERLGIPPRRLVLTYVGSFDKYHDLRPILEALAIVEGLDVQLRLVGDDAIGEHRYRCRYEQLAAERAVPVVFHGRVPHTEVPAYIAAADLCVAPYDLRAFVDGEMTAFTLKVPEYMACARPVVTVPSGHLRELVTDGVNGFLIPNETDQWAQLLRDLGSRERLRAMGQAAAEVTQDIAWANTAAGYWGVCRELLASVTGRAELRASPALEGK